MLCLKLSWALLPVVAAQTYSATAGSAFASHSPSANGNFPSSGGFQLDTDDFGAATLTSWTIAYDVRIASTSGTYVGLLQTSAANSGDADLFFKESSGTYGAGFNGDYDGSLAVDTWARVVFTYDGSTITAYYDGSQVNTISSSSQAITVGRSGADVLLMTDDTQGETGDGYLGAFALTNTALSASAVSALGGPVSTGIFADSSANTVEFRLDGRKCMQSAIGQGTLQLMSATETACSSTAWSATSGSAVVTHTGSGSSFPSDGGFQLDTDDFGSDAALTAWTIVYDVKIDAGFTRTYFGLLQPSATNAADAAFFYKKDTTGVYQAGSGTYYGAVNRGAWARVAFTYDGTSAKMYFNGVLQGTKTRPTSTHTITVGRTAADVMLLTDNTAGETGAGRLAAFAIKNSVLTGSEVTALGGPTNSYIFADGTSNVVEFRLDGSACMQAAVGTGTLQDMAQSAVTCTAGANGDPHINFAHGGTADFRGSHRTCYAFLSSPGYSFAPYFQEADFVYRTATPQIGLEQLVHGTFMTRAFWTIVTSAGTHVVLGADAMKQGQLDVLVISRGSSQSSATPGVSKLLPWQNMTIDDVSLATRMLSINVETPQWDVEITSKPIYGLMQPILNETHWHGHWEPGQRRFDIQTHGTSPQPHAHGIIGQSFRSHTVLSGKTDEYTLETHPELADSDGKLPEMTTSAQAEGAIEGVYADYALPTCTSTAFKYSRFEAVESPSSAVPPSRRTASTSEWDGKSRMRKKGL